MVTFLRAEVIFTGTELLLGQILNTNAQYLQQVLASLGIDLYYQVTVGDNLERLAEAITQARQRAELIIVGGGLGPTEDDLSREALAKSLGISLNLNAQALKIVRRFFDERHIPMPENNLKQAFTPEDGIVLDNPIGTAPGIIFEEQGKIYMLIPGPPSEFRLMVDQHVAPYLIQKPGRQKKVIKSRVLKLCGIGESMVDERLGELLRSANPTLAPTARFAEVHLRITAKASSPEEAFRMNSALEEKIRQQLNGYIFGTDEETLADAVSRVFSARHLTLATVETFTGGLLAYQLTTIPEAGRFFRFGFVFGLDRKYWPFLPSLKAVNEKEWSGQLASWGREKTRVDVCVAITAQAREETRRQSQPGATVYITTNIGGQSKTGEFNLGGVAQDIKERAVQITLALLWRLRS